MDSGQLPKPDFSSLNSRFNAHLTFNILNAVQGLVLENDNEKAFELIGHYSKLLRKMLIHNSIETHLEDELDLIKHYLEIEQIRMENNFQYSIRVPKSIKSQPIPKSFLIGLVENAIKHGIRPLRSKGYVKIDCISAKNQILRIRNNAPVISSHGGLGCGLEITHDILKRFNDRTGSFIQLTLNRRERRSKNEIEFETLINLTV